MDSCGRHGPVCPRYQRAAELLGRRWSAAVIRVTLDGPARFSEIRASVRGLSARLLAERLRELEAAGLMERRPGPAGSVEYRLTPKGVALAAVVAEIERWVATWEPEGGATAATAAARRPPGGRSAGG